MEPKIEIKEKETERIHVRELEPPSSPRLDPSVPPSSQVKIRLFFFLFLVFFFVLFIYGASGGFLFEHFFLLL
jgi:hypothetical protein